ncbi:MAG: hypothetical protein Q4G67_02780 [Actinomycetia bacterium]|nr:hypothetical protein [Actinomycetes bacterium]
MSPPKPAGRTAMFFTGLLLGAVLAAAVGVVLLEMRLASIGSAEEVIGGPTETVTATLEVTASPEDFDGEVPDPCVQSAEYNLQIDEQIDALAAGARDENARSMQEALDSIQEAREAGEGAAQDCLDLADQGRP